MFSKSHVTLRSQVQHKRISTMARVIDATASTDQKTLIALTRCLLFRTKHQLAWPTSAQCTVAHPLRTSVYCDSFRSDPPNATARMHMQKESSWSYSREAGHLESDRWVSISELGCPHACDRCADIRFPSH